MKKILVVCKGNICRSPLAHGLLNKKAKEQNLPWTIDSAGTAHWHIGKLPDKRSIKVAAEHDLDITYQRGRQFQVSDFDQFDEIYVMDNYNLSMVLDLSRSEVDRAKVDLIMNQLKPGQNLNVPDPFHHGEDNFQEVYRVLDKVTDKMIEKELMLADA